MNSTEPICRTPLLVVRPGATSCGPTRSYQELLRQSNISGKNLKRLETLRDHAEPEVAALVALVLDVALVLPGKRSRWLKLAHRHRPLFERAVGVLGLEYFQEYLAGYGDLESPLWDIMEDLRTWTG